MPVLAGVDIKQSSAWMYADCSFFDNKPLRLVQCADICKLKDEEVTYQGLWATLFTQADALTLRGAATTKLGDTKTKSASN
jgi:hypothetical protein